MEYMVLVCKPAMVTDGDHERLQEIPELVEDGLNKMAVLGWEPKTSFWNASSLCLILERPTASDVETEETHADSQDQKA